MRGWAPYGCPAKQRIDDVAAKNHLGILLGLLPSELRKKCKPAEPFATNHQLFIGVAGGYDSCYQVAEALQNKIIEKDYKIKGFELRAAVETSPARRSQCKLYFTALEYLESKKVDPTKFKCCPKGLKVYCAATYELLGHIKEGRWTWTARAQELLPAGCPGTLQDSDMA